MQTQQPQGTTTPLRFKPAPIQIPDEDPFREDLLARQQSAHVLADFVATLAEPFVLAINSPWGTGKTTFLKMWLQFLRRQGFHCLYFNAWENDFTDSPLVSLIGEVAAEMEARKLGDVDATLNQFLQKTKKAGVALLKSAAPTAIKLATSGMIDISHLKNDEIKQGVEALAETFAKEQIERYQADKKTIQHFRHELTQLVSALAETTGSPQKPLIFVVDELDRCRPPYAIELLEKIKHLFSVNGLVFVLSIDRRQLGESVKSLYGAGMDSDGYLRRFIDLEYQLPEPKPKEFVPAQIRRLGLENLLNQNHHRDHSDLQDVLPALFSHFRFSLRTQEQCLTHLALVVRTTPLGQGLYPFLLPLLLCLRVANHQLYADYCRGHATHEDIITFLRTLAGGDKFMDSQIGIFTEAFLIRGTRNETKRQAAMKHLYDLLKSPTISETTRLRLQEITSVFPHTPHMSFDIVNNIFNKLELTQRFV